MEDNETPSTKNVEAKSTEVEVKQTISVEDHVKLQKQLVDVQKQLSTMEADKVETQRQTALANLRIIDPKLADMNKDASTSTLEAVRVSVEQMSKGFKKHVSNNETPNDTENTGVGEYNAETKTWK